MLPLLPLFLLTPSRWSREFFIFTGVCLLTLLWGWVHAAALIGASVAAYALTEWTAARERPARKRAFVLGLLTLHAIYLLCFLLPPPPVADVHMHPLNAVGVYILFSGIGLLFFRATSYYHDRVRRGFSRASLRDYLAYQFYFPQLGHGPVERCHDAAEKLNAARKNLSWSSFGWGMGRVAWGVALAMLLGYIYETSKVIDRKLPRWMVERWDIAPTRVVDFFAEPEQLPVPLFLILLQLAPFGLYYLESMYAHLGLGVGRCFGFKGVEAYHYPFGVSKPCDFWHRWNMSLSTWLRDYSFLPLGGAKGRRHLATFLTFVYCGALHGLQLRNLVWGAWTGITVGVGIVIIEWWNGGKRLRRSRLRPGQKLTARERWRLYAGRFITYQWAVLSIIFIADPDYCGMRVLRRIGEILLAALAAPFGLFG